MALVSAKDLGTRIRELRERRQLTQEGLAEAADLAANTIRRLERGKFGPSFDTMLKLANGLHVPLAALLSDEYDLPDDLATMIRGLPEPHRQVATAILGVLCVQAVIQ
jgi:transcriptional regulator with XRE-family HTH domain